MSGDLEYKLLSAATQYDIKQSTKRGYNPNALAMYLGGVRAALDEYAQGGDIVAALKSQFNDRLLDHMLRSVTK